jgi:hypothetical protein
MCAHIICHVTILKIFFLIYIGMLSEQLPIGHDESHIVVVFVLYFYQYKVVDKRNGPYPTSYLYWLY